MKLTVRKTATAAELAEMHRHLGEAVQALQKAGAVRHDNYGPHALTCSAQDKLLNMARQAYGAALSLESEFMARTGNNAPFATVANPAAWEQWLSKPKAP